MDSAFDSGDFGQAVMNSVVVRFDYALPAVRCELQETFFFDGMGWQRIGLPRHRSFGEPLIVGECG